MSFSEQKTHILIVDNDEEQQRLIKEAFQSYAGSTELMIASTLEEANALLLAVVPDLAVINWHLPDGEGRELLPVLHKNLLQANPVLSGQFRRKPIYPVIFVNDRGNEHLALDSVRAGALDYIIKTDENLANLPKTVERVLREWDDLVLREQAEETMRTELARSELFYSTAHALVSLDSPTQKLQTIVDNVAEALPACQVVLNVLDLAKRQIMNTIIGGLDSEPLIEPAFDDLWDGLVGWSLRKLEPVISSKNSADFRERPQARQKRLTAQIGSLMVTPLVHKGRTLGVMSAYNRLDERDFTRNNLSLLTALAHQAAVVIEETRMAEEKQALVEQIQQQASRVERIMDAIPEGVILLNDQRRIIQVNSLGHDYLKFLGHANVGEILYSLNAVPIQTLLRPTNHAACNKVQITIDRHRHLEICACPVYKAAACTLDADPITETIEESAVSAPKDSSAVKDPQEWMILIRDITGYVASKLEASSKQAEAQNATPSLAFYASQIASTIARSLRNNVIP